jgi:hypothetical protein
MTRHGWWVAAALAAATFPGAAQAAPAMTKCKPRLAGTGFSGLGVIDVRAAGVGCGMAKRVARASDGTQAVVAGVRWSCRITKEATGTDPGSNPYSHVSCRRGTKALVRFKWAS